MEIGDSAAFFVHGEGELEFQKVVSLISTQLLSTPFEQFHDTLLYSLELAAYYFGADRSYLFLADPESTASQPIISNSHEWCADGVLPQRDSLQNIPLYEFPWFFRQLLENQIVYVHRLDLLPPEANVEREELKREGVESLIMTPFFINQQLTGMLGFDYVKEPKTWMPSQDSLLRVLAEIFAATLVNHRHETELRRLNEEFEHQVQLEVEKRRMSEKTLILQSRVAAMGEMLRAVSHHWRQPLTSISLLAEEIADNYDYREFDERRMREISTQIVSTVNKLSNTIDMVSGMVSKEEFTNFDSSLNHLQRLYLLLQPHLNDLNIELYAAFGSDNFHLLESCSEAATNAEPSHCYPVSFRQALLNILNNARDAIIERRNRPNEGSLVGRIEVRIDQIDDNEMITIEDNGIGLGRTDPERIFDPYYTTKEIGQGAGILSGSGLGLYICKLIIEDNMGGRIRAEHGRNGARIVINIPPRTYNEDIA